MKRSNSQNQGRANSRRERKATKPVHRRRLLMEGLEKRELLAVTGFASPSGGGGDTGFRFTTMARNIGSVNAVQISEVESNNTFGTAQVLPLGTGPGQIDTIDVSGRLTAADFATRRLQDIDYYALDLQAGDILDIATIGSVGAIDVFYSPNNPWFGAELDASFVGTTYPFASPLQTLGDITAAQTVPATGRYYVQLTLGDAEGLYTMGLRVYRPVMEQAPVGTKQVLFVDFNGASYPRSEFDPLQTGNARLSPMSQFIDDWGLRPQDENRIIDRMMEVIHDRFQWVADNANNGDFAATGIPGQYGFEIRNSRDHVDEYGINPYVSRVIVGGTVAESGVDTIGLASSIDIGNFDTAETGFVLLDSVADLILPIELAPGFTVIDTIATFLANVVVHEAGHYFGAWHQDNANATISIMDQGGDIIGFTQAGPDEIFGTIDDNEIEFFKDLFSPNESIYFGEEDVPNLIAFNLSTGKVGATVTGTIFNDTNRNGVKNNGEPGLVGYTVFADIDEDGILDPNEPSSVTTADGTYTLAVPPGEVDIRVILPAGAEGTTPLVQTVTVAPNRSVEANFGVRQVNVNFTGRKFADLDGDGAADTNEPGLAGVYIYLDIDGDDMIDLGEPQAVTDANGNYVINFPGPGTYVIREVVTPGFVQTFPLSGEHIVTYNGVTPITGRDFGNQPAQDWGDAPDPYPTEAADNGPFHGLVNGLRIGTLIDTEGNGVPDANALGDDSSNIDDEDGVEVLAPFSPGETGFFRVTVTNTTGSPAYLSGWMDMLRNNNWTDVDDKFLSDMVINSSGVFDIPATLPANASIGDTFVRFRLSTTPGVGLTGFASGGEVEDHMVPISESVEVANDDEFNVPRVIGSIDQDGDGNIDNEFVLNVLQNDFDRPQDPLTIDPVLGTTGTLGRAEVRADGRAILYVPPTGYIGPDSFTYTVRNESGTITGSATVFVNVVFQSNRPVAIDDSFNIPQSSTNQALNVLGNDIPSVTGGIRIIATSSPDNGGTVSITSGGQSLRYTPATGFRGTEQFTYTVTDTAGQISTAIATIHLQPDSTADDVARFIVETFANDGVTPINTIPAGQLFKLRVSVDDLRTLDAFQRAGLGSAYLDLLYNEGLVATVPGAAGTGFSFDVDFGGSFPNARTGTAGIPGIIDEIGAAQIADPNRVTVTADPLELFTITMRAVTPGIAEFISDPADASFSDTVFLNEYDAAGNQIPISELTPSEIFYGRRQLTIVPSGTDFVFAVDDSYPDQRDSDGTPIAGGQNAVLRVLQNDNRGPLGQISIVGIGGAANGQTSVNNNGTPDNTNDDYIQYRPNPDFVGVEQFTYTILSADGIQSTAEVTVTVGNAAADDLVAFDLRLFDSDGNPLDANSTINVGAEFEVQVWVDDLRPPLFGEARGVFAAYMDLLYNTILAEPTNSTGNRLGFDVVFNTPKFDPDTAVGDNFVPGLINEFGTFQTTAQGSGDPLEAEPVWLATINMIAKAPGTFRMIADPADVSPFQDTLLFQPPDVVPINRIRYDLADVRIVSAGEGESPFRNPRNRWDVNDDGNVSPIDALLVLNRLNRGGEGEGDSGSGDKPSVYWDVNGDRKISPIDALQVINHLNRRGPSGEGEAVGPVGGVMPTSAMLFAAAADSVFSEIGQFEGDEKLVGSDGGRSSSAGNTHAAGFCLPASSSADDSEEDDDNLNGLTGELS